MPALLALRARAGRRAPGRGRDDLDLHGLCQGKPTPWWHIDYPLLNYRVPAWIAWRYRISGLLYWGGMAYWNAGRRSVDRSQDLLGRAKARSSCYNGEGTLVYPGRAAGYDGIAPSLRLKALRDSIEDYEYLAIARRSAAGRGREDRAAAGRLLVRVGKDPAAYDRPGPTRRAHPLSQGEVKPPLSRFGRGVRGEGSLQRSTAMSFKPPPKPPMMIDRARRLRRSATPPEQLLWSILRGRRLGGLKFRRQEPIGPYVIDFCCREKKLIVELDGMSHMDRGEDDRRRGEWLTSQGYHVLRVTNTDVDDLDAVARLIAREAGIPWNA